MENTNIIPAKINEKPLKILGIISMAGGIGYILYMIINFFSDNYSVDFGEFAEVLIRNIFSHGPFILFGIYAIFLSKKKINHALLWVSYIVFAVYRAFLFIDNPSINHMFAQPIVGLDALFSGYSQMAGVCFDTAFDAWFNFLAPLFSILFIIDIIKNFKFSVVSKIFAILLLASPVLSALVFSIPNIFSFIFDDGLEYALRNTIILLLGLAETVPFFLFWFLVIKKGAKKIKLAPQPMAQPVYQAPVQPVAQPMYQAPAQPVAQPMYQAPVQPVAQPMYQAPVQPMIRETSPEEKLENFKRLLDDGLISQEDFDKKKAEILDKM